MSSDFSEREYDSGDDVERVKKGKTGGSGKRERQDDGGGGQKAKRARAKRPTVAEVRAETEAVLAVYETAMENLRGFKEFTESINKEVPGIFRLAQHQAKELGEVMCTMAKLVKDHKRELDDMRKDMDDMRKERHDLIAATKRETGETLSMVAKMHQQIASPLKISRSIRTSSSHTSHAREDPHALGLVFAPGADGLQPFNTDDLDV